MNSPLRNRLLAVSIAVFLSLPVVRAHGISLRWDVSTGNTTTLDGDGTWQSGAGNWTEVTTSNYATFTTVGQDRNFTNGDIAIFGAGSANPFTVTVSGTVQATSVAFAEKASYTLAGGTIELVGAASIISAFAGGNITAIPSAAIGSTITGTQGMTWIALGSLKLSGANTYTGDTTIANTQGGVVNVLTLDFSAAGAPTSDILYHGVTAGNLKFSDPSNNTTTLLLLQGAATGTNSQQFGDVTLGTSASNTRPIGASISVVSGASNTTDLTLGMIGRIGVNKTLTLTGPEQGTISAANANGLVGTWATYASADGTRGGWAGVTGNLGTGGTVGVFTGELQHVTGTAIASLGGYSASSNLTISSASSGSVTQAAGTTQINSISMTDTAAARTVAIGDGNTLRLGEAGGVQIVAGAKDLTIGSFGDTSILTAGNAGVSAAPATTDLILTNMSEAGTLTVNSAITNNGGNTSNDIVNLVVNGTGRVVLTGNNTFTGTSTIHHGVLAVQSSGALGTSAGGLVILNGGELQLSGNITLADTITAAGLGLNDTGSIHNVSGSNTITATVTLGTPGNSGLSNRFTSDAGTLTFDIAGGTATTSAVSGGNGSLYLSGAGDFVIKNRLQTGAGTTVKEGTGTLYLDGDNNLTGGIIINGGKVRVSRVNALAVTNGTHTLNDGTLEIINLNGGPDVHNVKTFRSNLPGRANLILTPQADSVTLNLGAYGRNVGSTLNYTTASGATVTTITSNTNGILSGGFTVDNSSWATSGVVQNTGVSWVDSSDTISLGGLVDGDQVAFATAPGGLSSNTAYYIVNSSGSTFQVSATLGGAVIALTNNGTTAVVNRSGAITGLESGSYSATFATNANVDVAAGTTSQGTVTVNTLRFNNAGPATVEMSGNLTFTSSGGILVTSVVGANDVTLLSSSTTARTLSGGDLVLHQHNTLGRLILGDATNPLNLSSGITNITKTGAGEVVLRGTAASSGTNVRIFEGTFTVDGSERFTGANNVNLTIGSSTTAGRVAFGNGATIGSETINSITPGIFGGNSLIGGGTALYTLTLDNGGIQDLTKLAIGGVGTNDNNLALTFTNTGTTTLGATNTYVGATVIDGGKVIVSGSLSGTAHVTVGSGATLASGAGGGAIAPGETTGNAVEISGTLSPGDTEIAPITFTLAGTARLNFNAGSELRLDVGADGASDTVIFGGAAADSLLGAGNATLTLLGVVDYGKTYTVFSNVATAGFSFLNITGYDDTNYDAVFALSGNDYQLSFAAVPEPGSLVSILGGFGLLVGVRRMRRRTLRS